jgi:toxin-antitoxin system protein
MNMEHTVIRQAASFRLNAELLDVLKRRAKEANRSLNNYVESVLLDAMYFEPNEETIAAIKEAKSGKELETLDLNDFENYIQSL